MDSYVKAITLDVNADENYTIIKAKQGDKINRKIAITLKKDGANFTPTGVSQIWFRVQKPDKNIAIVKSTDSGSPISSAGNVYTVTLSEQCLTASGKAWCDLAFLDSSGNTLSSCAFILNIIPMPNGNTARSISEWTDLQQAIDDAERFASIVAFRTSGNYIQYTVDGTTWVNLTTVGAIGGDLQTQINALNGAINNVQGQITANVETSTTASKAYVVGEFLVLNGVLYRVTSVIANGATITPNTNVTPFTIDKDLGFKSGDTLTINGTFQLQLAGFAVNANNIRFAFPLNKPVYSNSFTVTEIGGGFHVSGKSNIAIDSRNDNTISVVSPVIIDGVGLGFVVNVTDSRFTQNDVGTFQVQYITINFT